MKAHTPETLSRVGVALFGESYVMDLAEALDVSRRSLSRWLNDPKRFPPPEGIWQDLADLCEERGGELKRLAKELRQ